MFLVYYINKQWAKITNENKTIDVLLKYAAYEYVHQWSI